MSTFQYVGKNTDGRRVTGVLTADTPRAARDSLRASGVAIVRIQERTNNSGYPFIKKIHGRRLHSATTTLVRELSTLLKAGIPLLEAIDCCILQSPKRLRPHLTDLRERIAGGQSLTEALNEDSWLYDEMTRGMVRVGEHAGNLDDVLDHVASFREQASQLKDRVVTAILYPAIVFVVSIGVTLFLMTVVVPMLLTNIAELGGQLPWPTRVLKALSDGLLQHGSWIMTIVTVSLLLAAIWLNTDGGKTNVARMSLRLPVFGSLIRKQAISRLALVVACLLRSGVELVEAIEIAAASSSNLLLRRILLDIVQDIKQGLGLREAIGKHAFFPPAIPQIFALGQQSGQLEPMLERLGTDLDRQATILAGRVAAIAEPVLIIALSVIVGFILFATILPILEAGNVLAS